VPNYSPQQTWDPQPSVNAPTARDTIAWVSKTDRGDGFFMSSIRRQIVTSSHPAAIAIRRFARGVRSISLPAPKLIVRPILAAVVSTRALWHFIIRVGYAEPLFKGYCNTYGANLHTDIYLHWVMGSGDINLGNDVTIDGKCSFVFSSRYCNKPSINIGSRCHISNGCVFIAGKSISIGNNCLIASNVAIRDSDGHRVNADARLRHEPPDESDVRPVTIADNVWIGGGAVIGPGVTIGEGSVIASRAVVSVNVAPFCIVSGNPARKIGDVPRDTQDASSAPR
jgi:acetyltransferase-like isoleucine patch superfamily enzyme